ncbi:MAG: hypothetical protein ACKVX7_10515 [Planctomycetota bacterium]
MFSTSEFATAAADFVCVKVKPSRGHDALRYKSSGYIPEVVLIRPDGEAIGVLDTGDVGDVCDVLRNVAHATRAPSNAVANPGERVIPDF